MFTVTDRRFDFRCHPPTISPHQTSSPITAESIESTLKKDLKDRVQLHTTNDNYETFLIDGAIEVKTQPKAFINEKIQYWKKVGNTALKNALAGMCVSVLFLVAGTYVLPNPVLSVALLVASVAFAVYAGINMLKVPEASRQRDGWSTNFPEQIVKKRDSLFRMKADLFPLVMQGDLKLENETDLLSKVFHPTEVQFIFESHLDKFITSLLSEIPTDTQQLQNWLKQLTDNNPVSNKALVYAYGSVPQKYVPMLADFEAFSQHLQDLHAGFSILREKKKKESQQIISKIDFECYLMSTPSLQAVLRFAHAERFNKLITAKDENEKAQINREYYDTINRYQECIQQTDVYDRLVVFDSQQSFAKNDLKNLLQEINEKENRSLATYYGLAMSLLNSAKQVKDQPNFTYQPKDPTFEQVVDIRPLWNPPEVTLNYIRASHQPPVAGEGTV